MCSRHFDDGTIPLGKAKAANDVQEAGGPSSPMPLTPSGMSLLGHTGVTTMRDGTGWLCGETDGRPE